MSEPRKWDAFISHASEDKIPFVQKLAAELRGLGVNVWYDEYELVVGSSLSEKIDEGLSRSQFGVVVLSKAFFAKNWTKRELRGLVASDLTNGGGVILPVWLDVDFDAVFSFSPTLADAKAIVAIDSNAQAVALELIRTIRPEFYRSYLRKRTRYKILTDGTDVQNVSIKDVDFGPIRHPELPTWMVWQLRLIWASLLEVWDCDFDECVDGFKRDLEPELEIAVWRRIAFTYHEAKRYAAANEIDVKCADIFAYILTKTVDTEAAGRLAERLDAELIAFCERSAGQEMPIELTPPARGML